MERRYHSRSQPTTCWLLRAPLGNVHPKPTYPRTVLTPPPALSVAGMHHPRPITSPHGLSRRIPFCLRPAPWGHARLPRGRITFHFSHDRGTNCPTHTPSVPKGSVPGGTHKVREVGCRQQDYFSHAIRIIRLPALSPGETANTALGRTTSSKKIRAHPAPPPAVKRLPGTSGLLHGSPSHKGLRGAGSLGRLFMERASPPVVYHPYITSSKGCQRRLVFHHRPPVS